MRHNTQAHPLNAVLRSGHWNARRYLTAVAEAQRALGMSVSAIRPEKVSRWLAGATPDTDTQLAMAHMHGVPAARVQDLGWPRWLRLALPDDDEDLLEAWTAQTAVNALTRLGGPMKRRTLITYTPAAVTAAAALYSTAIPADAAHSRGRRIGPATADHIDHRLAALRRLDDELGSGPVHEMARADLALITHTLDNASYDETVARRLFAAAGEAARIAGWTAFDNGNSAVAERFYAGALRAAAAGNDPVTGATTLSFWAMQRYSEHDPQGGVHLIDEALRQGERTGSARMRAMLHARASRAHAKAGNARACAHAETAALTAYAQAPHPAEEPVPGLYWVDLGELYSWFASNATDLKLPRQALHHYLAIPQAHRREHHDTPAYPRGTALRLTRTAAAHLTLGDVDTAAAVATDVVTHLADVASTRSEGTLDSLRRDLAKHDRVPAVRDFLALTG